MPRQVTIDTTELNKLIAQFPALTSAAVAELDKALTMALVVTEGEVIKRTPKGVSGHLQQSWQTTQAHTSPTAAMGAVVSNWPYAAAVEYGRKPGKMPPVDAIELWVRRKLQIDDDKRARSVAFVIARAIGRRGTVGRYMAQLGLSAAQPYVIKLFDEAIDKAIKRFTNE